MLVKVVYDLKKTSDERGKREVTSRGSLLEGLQKISSSFKKLIRSYDIVKVFLLFIL